MKINLLMLYKAKVAVCAEIHTHSTQRQCDHQVELLNDIPSGT